MKKIKTIELKVKVTFAVSEGKEMVEEEEWAHALSLAITPNFHTIENGVSLNKVIVEDPNGAERTYIEENGTHGVFPIVNECSTDGVFFGTLAECISYGKKNYKPGQCIICPI